MLITAIYSESQVVAATLSQLQNLLEHDTLRKKPELLETFDRALTNCRVVYACLDEEVRELVLKAETDDLKFRDRAKFLWKEDTFKELLTQIRGQQSGLNLLVQGLQIESIADIKRLVQDNSVTLEMALKGTKTLRQTHPKVKVPESLFNRQDIQGEGSDNELLQLDTEFAFDDDVVNSKAYRRVMAMALSRSRTRVLDDPKTGPREEESTALGTVRQDDESKDACSTIIPLTSGGEDAANVTPESDAKPESATQAAPANEHSDLFGTLERDVLACMPPATSINVQSTPNLTLTSTGNPSAGKLTPSPITLPSGKYDTVELEATLPPLPSRHPSNDSSAASTPQMRSVSSDNSMYTSDAPTTFSQPSAGSLYTIHSASATSPNLLARPLRKPLPPASKRSYSNLRDRIDAPSEHTPSIPVPPFRNAEIRAIWSFLIDSERKYIDRMTKFKRIFYDPVIRQWPILEKHLSAILIGEQLAICHEHHILRALDQNLLSAHPETTCDPSVIEAWIPKAQQLYREYTCKMPHTASSLRKAQTADTRFTPFINTLGLSFVYFNRGWEDYLQLPRLQLQSYSDNLMNMVAIAETLTTPAAKQELERLRWALQAVKDFNASIAVLHEATQGKEDVQNVYKRLRMDSDDLSSLCLLDPSRRVKYQGGMALKYRSQGPWIPIHAVLFDHCFVWGKTKKSKGDEIPVTGKPVMLSDVEFSLPNEKHTFQKATMLHQITRGSAV